MTISTLIDSNVLIDIIGPQHREHRSWSLAKLRGVSEDGDVILSAVVWAELAFAEIEEQILMRVFSRFAPRRQDFPFAAAFPAGQAHRRYRERGGKRERTLPDFLIGAHALTAGHRLLTRDAIRYRDYFPGLDIIAPDTHP